MSRESADPFYCYEKEIRELKRKIKNQKNEITELELTNCILENEIKKLNGELFHAELNNFIDFKKITIAKKIELMFRLRFLEKE